jgi:hypothetical protein
MTEAVKAIRKFMRVYRIKTLSWIYVRALENKASWQTGIPVEGVALSFRSKKVWHNGTYRNGSFYIVGDRTKTAYTADVWYYLGNKTIDKIILV